MLTFLPIIFVGATVSYTALRNVGLGIPSNFIRHSCVRPPIWVTLPPLICPHASEWLLSTPHSSVLCVCVCCCCCWYSFCCLFVLLYNKHINNNECNSFTVNPLGLRKTAPHIAALHSCLVWFWNDFWFCQFAPTRSPLI